MHANKLVTGHHGLLPGNGSEDEVIVYRFILIITTHKSANNPKSIGVT
jgi:hypothetical protein